MSPQQKKYRIVRTGFGFQALSPSSARIVAFIQRLHEGKYIVMVKAGAWSGYADNEQNALDIMVAQLLVLNYSPAKTFG